MRTPVGWLAVTDQVAVALEGRGTWMPLEEVVAATGSFDPYVVSVALYMLQIGGFVRIHRAPLPCGVWVLFAWTGRPGIPAERLEQLLHAGGDR